MLKNYGNLGFRVPYLKYKSVNEFIDEIDDLICGNVCYSILEKIEYKEAWPNIS